MKRNKNSELLKKFWEGQTSLSDEESLFADKLSNGFNEDDRAYFNFIANARKVEYSGENEIWHSIVVNEHRRKMIIYLYSGIAASILLIVSLFIVYSTAPYNKSLKNQVVSDNLMDYYNAYRKENGSNPTIYINGCKLSSDYHSIIPTINPKCIQKIKMSNGGDVESMSRNKMGIVEVWLKGKPEEVFSVCEGTLFFYQDGEMKSITIDDDCSPNLLVDCLVLPLSEIKELKPQQIKSIELTTDPRNCNGLLDGEFIVMESK